MEKTNLLTLVITLTVGIILAGSLLMPILDDTTTTHDTYTNSGFISADVIDSSETYTFAWDPADQYTVTINDVDYDLTAAQSSEYSGFTIAFADDWVLRYNLDRVFICPLDSASASVESLATVDNGYTFTATLSGDTLTTVVNNVTKTYTVAGTGLIMSKDGEFVLKSGSAEAYILDTSHIYGAGRTNRAYSSIAGTAFNLNLDATVSEVTSHYAPNTWTVSGETTDATAVSGHDHLYKVNKITATVNDGVNGDTTITYNQIFVPAKVTAERSEHMDAGSIALLNALPILIIIGLVMAAVGAIFVKNRD